MPAMPSVLHVFDATLGPLAREQMLLARRRDAGSTLARIGDEHGRLDLPRPDVVVRRSFGWTLTAAPGIRALLERSSADRVVAWTCAAAEPAAACGAPTTLRLFEPPARRDRSRLRHAVRHGACLLAGSEPLAKRLRDEGLADSSVGTVPPLADQAPLPARADARARLGLAEDRFVLVAPEQELDGHGPRWVAWAMGLVRQATDRVRLVVPGRGRSVERARQFVRQAQFEAETLFVPDAADDALAAADVAVFARPDGYGAGALAQAVRAGLPIVAPSAGEMACWLQDGRTALLTAPAQPRSIARAIWRLCIEPDLARHLAAGARSELAARFGLAVRR